MAVFSISGTLFVKLTNNTINILTKKDPKNIKYNDISIITIYKKNYKKRNKT